MILSAQSIRKLKMIHPFCERTIVKSMSYGLGPASYDVRLAQDIILYPHEMTLASTYERIKIKSKTPIAQFVFNKLDEPTNLPYSGKYQNQKNKPIKAILK